MACRLVGWYCSRWPIGQFFRTLKLQGLKLEDSQLEEADRLIKLTAIAARAAVITMELAQGRDGSTGQSAEIAFAAKESRPCRPCDLSSKARSLFRRTPVRPAFGACVSAGKRPLRLRDHVLDVASTPPPARTYKSFATVLRVRLIGVSLLGLYR